MDERAARLADRLTAGFYARCGESFSATRTGGWPGWSRLEGPLRDAARRAADEGRALRVLDLGCGNLRFERWLEGLLPGAAVEVIGLDREPGLAAGASGATVGGGGGSDGPASGLSAEVVAAEFGDGWGLPTAFEGGFDVAVAFGLLHHLTGFCGRRAVIEGLARALAPGGVAAASCWRFLDDRRLAAKAREATADALARWPELAGRLGPGDAFLGWQGEEGVFRFCHAVDEAELDRLVAAAAAAAPGVREAGRFSADGRSGELNRYVVLES
ncbi:class I SAM-dependent methyltransferase [Atopobiaceae bacterium 24-176]